MAREPGRQLIVRPSTSAQGRLTPRPPALREPQGRLGYQPGNVPSLPRRAGLPAPDCWDIPGLSGSSGPQPPFPGPGLLARDAWMVLGVVGFGIAAAAGATVVGYGIGFLAALCALAVFLGWRAVLISMGVFAAIFAVVVISNANGHKNRPKAAPTCDVKPAIDADRPVWRNRCG